MRDSTISTEFHEWICCWTALLATEKNAISSTNFRRFYCSLIGQEDSTFLISGRSGFYLWNVLTSQKQMSQTKILKYQGKWQLSPFHLPSAKMKSWLTTGIFLGIMPAQLFFFILLQLFFPDSCRNEAYAILLCALVSSSLPHPRNLLNLLANFNPLISQRKSSSYKLCENNLLTERLAAVWTGTISDRGKPTFRKSVYL